MCLPANHSPNFCMCSLSMESEEFQWRELMALCADAVSLYHLLPRTCTSHASTRKHQESAST